MASETTTALAPARLANAMLTAGAVFHLPFSDFAQRHARACSSRGPCVIFATSRKYTGDPLAERTVSMPTSCADDNVRPAVTATALPSSRILPSGKLRDRKSVV